MFQGSIPALVTPMCADGSVDLDAWDRLLDFHVREGTDAVVVGGTTGESPTLEREELTTLVRRARDRLAGRMPVIAGSGTNSTAQSISLSRAAEAAGADGLLLVTPYYNRPTQEGLYRHFMAVAESVGAPIVLYNVPSRTACDLLPETIARLSVHPRIVGVKEATGDLARAAPILRDSRPGFLLLSGDDPSAAALMRAGARGVISVTANVAARAMHEMCAAALAGRYDAAEALNEQLMPLHRAMFVEANPIPVKWAAARMGLIGPGLRLPLTPLSGARQAEVLAAMRACGLVSA
jgi:4-hydroxy-tetrahydrodipicolinate synthase